MGQYSGRQVILHACLLPAEERSHDDGGQGRWSVGAPSLMDMDPELQVSEVNAGRIINHMPAYI